MTAVSETPADWYPDPDNAGILRFWDGSAWTDRRKPMQSGPQEVVVRGGNHGFVIFIVLVLALAVVCTFAYYFA